MSEQTNKKKNKKILIILVCIAAIIAMAVVLWLAWLDSEYLEFDVSLAIDSPASKDNFYEFLPVEKEYTEASPFVKMFFSYKDEMAARRAAYNAIIKEDADKIAQGIDALPTYTKIESREQYEQIVSSIAALQLNPENVYDEAVCQAVDNYDRLERYIQEIAALRDTYKHNCEECETRGYVTCTTCHGKGKETCSSCRGSGKQTQTWYEYGDYGDKSYTNSTCGSCKGSGSVKCSICDYGRWDCGCEDGYVYIYEDQK